MSLDAHVYSASSDGECSVESGVDSLSKISDFKLWKVAVEQRFRELSERVTELEFPPSKKSLSFKNKYQSFATAEDDGYFGYLTCFRLIRSKRAALFQFILLVLFICTLAAVCTVQFLRVQKNIEAEFKPEKKSKTVNFYEANDGGLKYDMPYIYIYFQCGLLRFKGSGSDNWNWTSENVNETLKDLLNSQPFSTSMKHLTMKDGKNVEPLSLEEAKAFYINDFVGPRGRKGFFGYFRLKLEKPEYSNEYFDFRVSISTQALTLGNKLWVRGLWVSVGREMSLKRGNRESVYFEMHSDNLGRDNSSIRAFIDFDEKVTRKWNNEDVHLFSSSLAWYEKKVLKDWEANSVVLTFRGNVEIEHWVEYLDYGYYEWFAGMGGLVGLSSIVFYWVGHKLAILLGTDKEMGILPKISKVYMNFENVQILKEQTM